MIFLGTSIVGGSGRALVTATGMETEVGHIADLLETATRDRPRYNSDWIVARRFLWACLGIVTLVFALGLLRAMPPFELFLGASASRSRRFPKASLPW